VFFSFSRKKKMLRIIQTTPATIRETETFINDDSNASVTESLSQDDDDDDNISCISLFSDTGSTSCDDEKCSSGSSLFVSKNPFANITTGTGTGTGNLNLNEVDDDDDDNEYLPSFWGMPSMTTMKSSKYNLPSSLFSHYQQHRLNQKLSSAHKVVAAETIHTADLTVCSSFSTSSSSMSSSIVDDNSILDSEIDDNNSKCTDTTSTTNEGGNNFKLLGHRPKRLQRHRRSISIGSLVGQSTLMVEIKSLSDDESSLLSCDDTADIIPGASFDDSIDERNNRGNAGASVQSETQEKKKKKKQDGLVKSEMKYLLKTLKSPLVQLKMNRKVILHRSSTGYLT